MSDLFRLPLAESDDAAEQLAVEFVDPRSKQADQSAEHVNATDALLCAGNVMRRARARSEQKNKRSNETEFSHWSQSPRERFLGT